MAALLSFFPRFYLVVYNWVVFFGWVRVLFLALSTSMESGHEPVYRAVQYPLQLVQTAAAVSEILHGVVGMVRSPKVATLPLPRVASRIFLTWGVLYSFSETRSHVLVSSLVVNWSIIEMIHYLFFGTNDVLGFVPSWLVWVRSSSFVLLYPTRFASEVGLLYVALPYIKVSEKYCIRMPNKLNFSFDYYYLSLVFLGVYAPGSAYLYFYMLGQWKKAVGRAKREYNYCMMVDLLSSNFC